TRALVTSSSICEKLAQLRVTPMPGMWVLETSTRSSLKNSRNTLSAAPEVIACPDGYSGNPGVLHNGSQVGSLASAALPGPPPTNCVSVLSAIGRTLVQLVSSGGPNPGVCCHTPALGAGVSMSTAWSWPSSARDARKRSATSLPSASPSALPVPSGTLASV